MSHLWEACQGFELGVSNLTWVPQFLPPTDLLRGLGAPWSTASFGYYRGPVSE